MAVGLFLNGPNAAASIAPTLIRHNDDKGNRHLALKASRPIEFFRNFDSSSMRGFCSKMANDRTSFEVQPLYCICLMLAYFYECDYRRATKLSRDRGAPTRCHSDQQVRRHRFHRSTSSLTRCRTGTQLINKFASTESLTRAGRL